MVSPSADGARPCLTCDAFFVPGTHYKGNYCDGCREEMREVASLDDIDLDYDWESNVGTEPTCDPNKL